MKLEYPEPFQPDYQITVRINPCAKPRQTRSDVWKKRPIVLKYRKFADDLRAEFNRKRVEISDCLECQFIIQMPKSWSKKKRAEMMGKPHQQRPDLDNLEKAVQDALCKEDSHIHKHKTSKVWGLEGSIIFKGVKWKE
jgi:Holliday junction resolvase RusA-like endonuclease